MAARARTIPQARERLLVQMLTLLFFAAWAGLFLLIAFKLLHPELRQLETRL